jgi:hypothetical protein
MNDDSTPPNMLGNIRSEQQIAQVMSNRRYKGLTPFGSKLRQKVIDGIVLPKLRQPRKPVLIIGITDGQPAGENAGARGYHPLRRQLHPELGPWRHCLPVRTGWKRSEG